MYTFPQNTLYRELDFNSDDGFGADVREPEDENETDQD